MAKLLNLETFVNDRGNLTVIEKILPFEIKRAFFIYGVDDSVRGMHRHKTTIQAAVCLQGCCDIYNRGRVGGNTELFVLDKPSKCLLIYPEDYHWMKNFSPDCILLVLASTNFEEGDYIYEPYA